MDGFAIIAEPGRRAIIDRLQQGECDVGELVGGLNLSQSVTSKHLRVLREAGVVEATVAGKRRIYRLAPRPLPEVLDWVAPYVLRWSDSFTKLAAALEAEDRR